MNPRPFRAGLVAAAVVLVCGVVVVAAPSRAGSVVRLGLVALAAVAGIHALMVLAPGGSVTGRRTSPFEGSRPVDDERRASEELEGIAARLRGRRHPLVRGRWLPPETVRLLRPLVAGALERAGLDPEDEPREAAVRAGLSPLSRAILTAELPAAPPWYRTRRARPRKVADAVHRVLDDVDRLTGLSAGPSSPSPDSRPPAS